jgi:hypothetical protein
MRAHEGPRQRISLGALIALTDEMTSTPTPRRDWSMARATARTNGRAWARMSTLERALAADRDDPSFDYAAN